MLPRKIGQVSVHQGSCNHYHGPMPAIVRRLYPSIKYTERLAEAGIETSVGSVGDSYDNAMTDSIIGLFKTEVIKRLGPWKSINQNEWETLKWGDWYNF